MTAYDDNPAQHKQYKMKLSVHEHKQLTKININIWGNKNIGKLQASWGIGSTGGVITLQDVRRLPTCNVKVNETPVIVHYSPRSSKELQQVNSTSNQSQNSGRRVKIREEDLPNVDPPCRLGVKPKAYPWDIPSKPPRCQQMSFNNCVLASESGAGWEVASGNRTTTDGRQGRAQPWPWTGGPVVKLKEKLEAYLQKMSLFSAISAKKCCVTSRMGLELQEKWIQH